jgi:hypothetical protein
VTASCRPLFSLSDSDSSESCAAKVDRGRFPSEEEGVGFDKDFAPILFEGLEDSEKPLIVGLGVEEPD